MLDKSKVKIKLLKNTSYWITKNCLICNKGISLQDIESGNFEQINNKYIHSSCFNNHIPRLD